MSEPVNSNPTLLKGYKAFNADFRCRDFQYQVGMTFETPEIPTMCAHGFHFCQLPVFVSTYYNWIHDTSIRFAEVESMGTTLTVWDKSVTNRIRIVREIPREEFEQLCTGVFHLNDVEYHYSRGHLHREDGPAVTFSNGTKQWFRGGLRHREDGPAVEYVNGAREWHHRGRLHREDGPAMISEYGECRWYSHGLLHKEEQIKKE